MGINKEFKKLTQYDLQSTAQGQDQVNDSSLDFCR